MTSLSGRMVASNAPPLPAVHPRGNAVTLFMWMVFIVGWMIVGLTPWGLALILIPTGFWLGGGS